MMRNNDNRSKHPLYKTYYGMLKRCTSDKDKRWHRYGGRGITVCERWLEPVKGFWNFVDDIGIKPTPDHSIDRIDNDKGYSPDNCKWSTKLEQNNNTVSNVNITVGKHTRSISEWSRVTGIRISTIVSRQRDGWSDERAVTTPARKYTEWRIKQLKEELNKEVV